MALPLNPYVAGNPVGDSPAFVGRADVLREVLRVLRQPQSNGIVLFGQRRIGKTSILQHLAARLPDEGPYQAVDFDLQDKADWPLARVLRELARTIAHTLGRPDPDLGDDAETSFRDEWLPTVLDGLPEGCSLVLLFDEFDVLADPKKEQAAAAFFPYLRRLLASDPARLQFVFVIGRNVDDLDTIALSLFKGTPYQRVSLLSREDTAELVRLSGRNDTLTWSDEAVERVWQLTNGHPFLTQQLCSHVWEWTYEEEPDEPPAASPEDVDEAVPAALDASRNTLEWLWDGLPPAERVVASALAEAGPGPITQDELERLLHESGVRVVIRELQSAPQLLQEWDLIEPADGGDRPSAGAGYNFRVELMRRWLAEYKPLYRVQEEVDRIEPVAEDLYQAAKRYYQGEQLDQAVDRLREAIGINPNHVRANQLLADILLAQEKPSEARELLERLYGYQPAAARHRLVQALLTLAQAAESDDEQLAFPNRVLKRLRPVRVASQIADEQLALYERVLELNRDQPEAAAGRQRIWQQRGDTALKSDNLDAALQTYREAGLTDKVAEVEQKIRHRDFLAHLRELEDLEQKGRYQDALNLAVKLDDEYSEMRDLKPDLQRLRRKIELTTPYQRALKAPQGGDQQMAQTLLAEVVVSDPEYEEATRYLHLAVTGVDVAELQTNARRTGLVVSGILIVVVLLGIALWPSGNRLHSALVPSPVPTLTVSTPTRTITPEPKPISDTSTPSEQPPAISTPTISPTVAPYLWGLHQVCAGETLSEIAEEYRTTIDQLATINSISNPDQIFTARLLLVPRRANSTEVPEFQLHTVTSEDTLTILADIYSTSGGAIQAMNGLLNPDTISPGDELRVPVNLALDPELNECAEFPGRVDLPGGAPTELLRRSPALEDEEPRSVVSNNTSLSVLGRNEGANEETWYKVLVEVRAGGTRIGWLLSEWVVLEESVLLEDIPLIEQ